MDKLTFTNKNDETLQYSLSTFNLDLNDPTGAYVNFNIYNMSGIFLHQEALNITSEKLNNLLNSTTTLTIGEALNTLCINILKEKIEKVIL